MKKAKKKRVCRSDGYYRPTKTNPNWFDIWTEQITNGIPAAQVLDQLCRMACGVEIGASDAVQRNAKHIHACLIAAYKVGKAEEATDESI